MHPWHNLPRQGKWKMKIGQWTMENIRCRRWQIYLHTQSQYLTWYASVSNSISSQGRASWYS